MFQRLTGLRTGTTGLMTEISILMAGGRKPMWRRLLSVGADAVTISRPSELPTQEKTSIFVTLNPAFWTHEVLDPLNSHRTYTYRLNQKTLRHFLPPPIHSSLRAGLNFVKDRLRLGNSSKLIALTLHYLDKTVIPPTSQSNYHERHTSTNRNRTV